MPRVRARPLAALACAIALAGGVGGCAQQLSGLTEAQENGWFTKPVSLFTKPEWATLSSTNAELGPRGPVSPGDLVSADGQCAPAAAEPAASAASAAPASESGLGGGAPAAPVAGGIALGMTECQAVHRAGTPSHVAISAGEGGERRVVLTYLSGPWPGIYTFDSGRLKAVDAAPVPDKKAEPVKKKKAAKRAKAREPAKVQ